MKTSDLIGPALDWAVAKCEGFDYLNHQNLTRITTSANSWQPSTDWAQGGPINDREMSKENGRLCVKNETYATETLPRFSAEYTGHNWEQYRKMYGPTPLVAAMRCLVASKLGDEVEIPEELSK